MISCSRLDKPSNELAFFCMSFGFPNLFFVFENLSPIWFKRKRGGSPPLLAYLKRSGKLRGTSPRDPGLPAPWRLFIALLLIPVV
jgi:hypothetical protein